MKQIDALLNHYWETVQEYWHWLHAHPELSGMEKQSAAYIAAALRQMGLTPIENVGGYGVTAVIEGAKPGKCVGLRADFDALPIQECTGAAFASENPGVMHACGHDAHTAMLLGVAHILCELRDQFSGAVKLIFQPAEEGGTESGAKAMIRDGVLLNPKVDAMIGQHVSSGDPTGMIGVKSGAMTAASDRFVITVRGKSCHASRPDRGIDAIAIGAQIITALQNIVSRTVSPFDSSVITVGCLSAGSRYNVVAESCTMEGTCRNLNPEVRDAIPERMEKLVKGIAEGMGASCDFTYIRGYSPTVNHPELSKLVADTAAGILGKEHVRIREQAEMGGEDFSFFTERVPSVYYHLGCHREGTPPCPVHNAHFLPDAEALKIGIRVMTETALNYLSKP